VCSQHRHHHGGSTPQNKLEHCILFFCECVEWLLVMVLALTEKKRKKQKGLFGINLF
jgi:hypothetical protein